MFMMIPVNIIFYCVGIHSECLMDQRTLLLNLNKNGLYIYFCFLFFCLFACTEIFLFDWDSLTSVDFSVCCCVISFFVPLIFV